MDPKYTREAEAQEPDRREHDREDERLDEELEETFPASDPIPYRHDG